MSVTVDLPRRAALGACRLHAAGAGVRQPAEQRREIHRSRRPHRGVSAAVDAGEAVVTITDTGIGIDPAALPRIFDMFVQIEPTASRARSGLGIGLALAKRLIELHDGQIEARSEGAGTGCDVRRAAAARRGGAAEAARPVVPLRAIGSCRVLVAEDIPDAAEMMRLMIECMGHDVRVAADGVQAVEIAGEVRAADRAARHRDAAHGRLRGRAAAFAPRSVAASSSSRSPGGARNRISAAPMPPASITTSPNPPSPTSLESLIASAMESRPPEPSP